MDNLIIIVSVVSVALVAGIISLSVVGFKRLTSKIEDEIVREHYKHED